jgi:hypothetical protein
MERAQRAKTLTVENIGLEFLCDEHSRLPDRYAPAA